MSGIIWISHRGYCVDAIENTRAAFDASIQAGFTYLETDLRCTKDGGLVLHHDPDTKRLFGFDHIIHNSRFEDMTALGLLGFEEFIDRYAAYSWIFDIKPESAAATLNALKAWTVKHKAEDWLNHHGRILLWSRRDAKLGRKLFPGLSQMAREAECYRAGLAVLSKLPMLGALQRGKTYSLPRFFAGHDLYSPSIADAYHRRGARLLAYLPNSEADASAAIAAGYDEILTNNIPLK